MIKGKSDETLAGTSDRQNALNRWTAGNAKEVFYYHPDDDLVPDSRSRWD